MNNKKNYNLKDLNKFYLPSMIFKSFLTGFIFFVFPVALLVTLTVNVMLLYIYNTLYFAIGLYVLTVGVAYFSNKIVIQTLKNYGDKSSELDYDKIHLIITIIAGVVILVIFAIIFGIFL